MNHEANELTIQTPEGITFSLALAAPPTRALAWLVDQVCILVAHRVAMLVAIWVGILGPQYAVATMMLAFFVISIGYPIALEWLWRGQTLGKRLLRLRVVDEQGLRLQFSQVVIRNLLRFVDAPIPFFFAIGGIVSFISPRRQRLGDIAANTIVIRERHTKQPDLDELLADKYNSFRACPHLEARLRQRISPEAAHVALQALVRRNGLEPTARVELFAEIAQHFRSLVAFPEEASLGLTDEQYVRNTVDVVFRTRGPAAPSPTQANAVGRGASD